jgi:hypothetical protein
LHHPFSESAAAVTPGVEVLLHSCHCFFTIKAAKAMLMLMVTFALSVFIFTTGHWDGEKSNLCRSLKLWRRRKDGLSG